MLLLLEAEQTWLTERVGIQRDSGAEINEVPKFALANDARADGASLGLACRVQGVKRLRRRGGDCRSGTAALSRCSRLGADSNGPRRQGVVPLDRRAKHICAQARTEGVLHVKRATTT